MQRLLLVLVFLSVFYDARAGDPVPKFKEPLKEIYSGQDEIIGPVQLFRVPGTMTGVRLTCNVGKAIPDNSREDWYTNTPIAGLTLEAHPALVNPSELEDVSDSTSGWIVLIKNGQVLKQLEPLGSDWFLAWHNEGTDYRLYSGAEGAVSIDLLGGDGFYYQDGFGEEPRYFLTNCTRTEVKSLPVYDYRFDDLVEVEKDNPD